MDERPEIVRVPRARLVTVFPRGLDVVIDLGTEERTIGREEILERTISRRHCSVTWDRRRGVHVAADLGSRNGTAVDGGTTGERALVDGSVLRMGDVVMIYERPCEARDVAEWQRLLPGRAPGMVVLRAALARCATDRAPVLVQGETGTGKEYASRALHDASGRPGPLVAVNCAALSPQLVEAQLFGHMRGSFTGAIGDQAGFFRAADRGTLFLDEIGELPLELQPKLLRAIQDGAVVPVGGAKAIDIDVRIVAATNRALGDEVAAGRFRRDLYARLVLWELHVPPLRQRRIDVLDWIARLAADRGVTVPALHPRTVEQLLLHDWPENLRGLERLVLALTSIEHAPIEPADLPPWLAPPTPRPAETASRRRQAPGRERMHALWAETNGNVRAISRILECERRQVYRWLAAYGLERQPALGEG